MTKLAGILVIAIGSVMVGWNGQNSWAAVGGGLIALGVLLFSNSH